MSKSSICLRDCYLARSAESPALSSGAHRAQYVSPYGIGGNPFGVDVFGSAMQLFDKIAARVFGPWRLPVLATVHDGKMPVDVRTRSSASEEARYSPSRDQNIQRPRAFT